MRNQLTTLTLVLALSTALLPRTGSAAITYYHTDALGSPVAATDENGTVIWRAQYWPYGDKTTTDGAGQPLFGIDNSRWYTGHEHDEDSGLTYMQGRYYEPVVGRFMGVDARGFVSANTQSFNRYAYANNNPYGFIDPDGRASVAVGGQGTASVVVGPGLSSGVYVSFPIPGFDSTPLDAGSYLSGSAITGFDANASLNLTVLLGGQENLEGLSSVVTWGFALPGEGTGIELQSITNIDTGEWAGFSIGVAKSAIPITISHSFTFSQVGSVRDRIPSGSKESDSQNGGGPDESWDQGFRDALDFLEAFF